jgi:hypothetical protein
MFFRPSCWLPVAGRSEKMPRDHRSCPPRAPEGRKGAYYVASSCRFCPQKPEKSPQLRTGAPVGTAEGTRALSAGAFLRGLIVSSLSVKTRESARKNARNHRSLSPGSTGGQERVYVRGPHRVDFAQKNARKSPRLCTGIQSGNRSSSGTRFGTQRVAQGASPHGGPDRGRILVAAPRRRHQRVMNPFSRLAA